MSPAPTAPDRTDPDRAAAVPRRRRRIVGALGIAVVVVAGYLVWAVTRPPVARACTAAILVEPGPEAESPDAAFELWWEQADREGWRVSGRPGEDLPAWPASRDAFEAQGGGWWDRPFTAVDGGAWEWEFAEGESVLVEATRGPGTDTFAVGAVNRCTHVEPP